MLLFGKKWEPWGCYRINYKKIEITTELRKNY